MEFDALVEDLEAAGLEQDQAQIYVRLLDTGPSGVGHLSQFFDVSRSTLYRLLDELAEKGYVTKSLERPTIYEPAQPEQLFEHRMDVLNRHRRRLAAVRDRRIEDLRSLAEGVSRAGNEHHWRKIETAPKIYEDLQDMIEEAARSFWMVSNHEITVSGSLPVVEETWRLARRRAAEDGLDVRLLLAREQGVGDARPAWIEPGERFQLGRFSVKGTVHFALVDGSDLVMWVRPTPPGTFGGQDDIAVRTNAPGSVSTHKLLFEQLWAGNDRVEPSG